MVDQKFTLEEYDAYQNAANWEHDDADGTWNDEDDYHAYWCKQVKDYQQQYTSAFQDTTDQWQAAIDYLEQSPMIKSFDQFIPDVQIAQDAIPLALTCMLEVIALLYSNYPQPLFISPNENTDKFANCATQLTEWELRANSFNSLMFDVGFDIGITNMGVLKVYVDHDQPGPYGNDGKIIIQRIDPMKVAFDPKAKRLIWSDLGFVLVEDFFDLGTARKMFPAHADLIESSYKAEGRPDKEGLFGHKIKSPVSSPLEGGSSPKRRQVKIVECWLKDDRLKFQADEEGKDNMPTVIVPETGEEIINPEYDSGKPRAYTGPVVDKEGHVVGRWVPAYPHGRCIVTCNDQYVISDFANPLWHKQAPFIFGRGRPSRKLVTTGDLTNIITVVRKINDIDSRIHIMAQAEIERPMLAERNTFPTPRSWMRMTGQSTAVLVKNSGKEFMRMPPTEIPQFVWAYLQRLDGYLDRMMAIAGVMRGQLAEGSQLSAEAVSSLQGFATTMLKMKAEFIAEMIKSLAYQMMWLERETYPENVVVKVLMPDGNTIDVKWNEQDPNSDYIVDIQSGTGLPGAHEQQAAQVIPLHREGLIDTEQGVQMLKIRGWQGMLKRMNDKKLQQIEAEATGRALGLNIKRFEKEKDANVAGAAPKG